jgi:hypothetical protein
MPMHSYDVTYIVVENRRGGFAQLALILRLWLWYADLTNQDIHNYHSRVATD